MLSNLYFIVLSIVLLSSCTKAANDGNSPPEKVEKFIIEEPFTDFSLVNHHQVVAEQSDGKIVLVLQNGQLKRISKDGAADPSFVPPTINGYPLISDMAVQKDDKIIIIGTIELLEHGNFNVIRLNKDGSFDNSFTVDRFTNGTPNIVRIQEDGKIILAGLFFYTRNGINHAHIVRLNTDGSYDDGFSPGIQTNMNSSFAINSVLIDGQGKIVIAGGELYDGNANRYSYILRLNANGTLDNSFNFNSILFPQGNSSRIFQIARQSDEKILVSGAFNGVGVDYDHMISVNSMFRLNSNGSVDNSFIATDSVKTYINIIQVLKDDRLLIGRQSTGAFDSSFLRIFSPKGELSGFRVSIPQGVISRIIPENDSTFLLSGSFNEPARPYGLVRLKRIVD
jgi:uncharacterized delta-60 repeat protein